MTLHRTRVKSSSCSMQGLVDAHVHIMAGGLTLQRVDLRGVNSKEGFEAAVKAAVGKHAQQQQQSLHLRTMAQEGYVTA